MEKNQEVSISEEKNKDNKANQPQSNSKKAINLFPSEEKKEDLSLPTHFNKSQSTKIQIQSIDDESIENSNYLIVGIR